MGIWPVLANLIFHDVHHLYATAQYQSHCRIVPPLHWHPVKYGHWEMAARMICRIYDRAGTMHPHQIPAMLRNWWHLVA